MCESERERESQMMSMMNIAAIFNLSSHPSEPTPTTMAGDEEEIFGNNLSRLESSKVILYIYIYIWNIHLNN
jgi:hypothetical protein